jgi:hypothetical protein
MPSTNVMTAASAADVQDEHVALLLQLLLVKTVGDSGDDRVVEDLGRFESRVAPTNPCLSMKQSTGASFISSVEQHVCSG